MAIVTVEGVFMGANMDKRQFDGKDKYSVLIDVYQPTSPLKDKALQVKTEELEVLTSLTNEYTTGDVITLKCSVNAYKNDAYYKLVDIVKGA